MRDVTEMAELRLALGRIHQVDADVRIGSLDVWRAARQRDDFPLSGPEKMPEQVPSDHPGCARNERFSLGHAHLPKYLSRHRTMVAAPTPGIPFATTRQSQSGVSRHETCCW